MIANEALCFQGPAQAQNLRDSLAEAKSDIVVKVCDSCFNLLFSSVLSIIY